ncbi:MAG: peptide chain release factor N(5)-glutamine methyltransferase [Sphingomonadaceae bacterium]
MEGEEKTLADRDTVGELLARASARLARAGIPSPQDEARILMAETLCVSRTWVIAHPEATVPPDRRLTFDSYVARRAAHEPEAYIVGRREFYGLEFEVDCSVLIPRPETELLVDHALASSDRLQAVKGRQILAVELGTGSGAVAIVMAMRRPGLRLVAVEKSPAALAVARRNAVLHMVADRIEFRLGDLLDGVTEEVDLLVANLPYVPTEEIGTLMPDVRDYEPVEALDGGPDGTAVIQRALEQATVVMGHPAALVFETGDGQGARLTEVSRTLYPGATIRILRDYAGFERILSIETL